MIQTGFESRIKVQDLIDHQLPEFILEESPNAVEFLKQYYISQEYQGGPIDISDNLDQYLKLDNLKPEVIVDSTTTSNSVSSTDTTISVSNTKGFPNQYGLLKIDNEVITYTGITTNSFTGCVRGFSGVTDYHQDLNRGELVFSTSTAAEHSNDTSVQNLSSLFLKDFYKKLKYTFTPGLENIKFADEIDVGNFIRRAKDFYASKGTDEAIKILFKVIFGETPSIVNLEDYLIKPSSANYVRREVAIAEVISGEPSKIVGQTLIKTTDENTTASISAIEPFSRKGKTFHKIEFYIGNTTDSSSVQGNFEITPNTKLIESVSIGSSILTVDSTLSFPQSGTLISGSNTISYTGKSINQFYGCTGINDIITTSSNIRSKDTYFSYEDGDTSKKVELILLGVIQDLVEENEDFKVDENDIITIKNLGDKIKNENSNWKEIFANSFIYNTSTRYQIVNNSTNELGSTIDRSSLKIGDEVEILERGSETIVFSSNTPYIQNIDVSENSLTLINKPTLDSSKEYDVRRKLNKTKSSGSNFGSSSVLSDILNVYADKDEYAYVASNSLPSEEKNGIVDYRLDIETGIKKVSIASTFNIPEISGVNNFYNIIEFNPSVPFLTGDKVYYFPQNESLIGLQTGNYYVKVISTNQFKLYTTPSLLDSDSNVTFQVPNSGIGTHTFTLDSQRKNDIGIQKLLRKFPLEKNIENGSGTLTTPGTTGVLINGVEINNYKSKDVVYYGPIEDVDILSGGEDFDIINPPLVEVSAGAGITAKIQPVISGGFEKVYVDSQDYNIEEITSINISGGNGSGAVIEPVIIEKPREVLFDADEFSSGGGVSETTNQILFLTDHNFVNGQEVIYNSLGNNPIAIGTAGNNINLPTNSVYYVGVTNNKAIKLYNTLSDQQLDINVVGIYTGSVGTHKFSTLSSSRQVSYIKVINKGEGYTNRKLIAPAIGISTTQNSINFKNHGFNSGEIIEYAGSVSGTLTFKKGGIAGKFFNGSWRSVISTGNIGSIPLTTANDSSNVTGTSGLPDPSYRFGVNFWSSVNFGNSIGDYYGWIGVGYFRPRVSGTYRFYTRSDDGSGIWIGDLALEGQTRTKANATLDNGMGSGQAATERSATIDLIAGVYYPFRVVMEETTGGDSFRISYEGPGITKTTDLSEDFYASATKDGTITGNFGAPIPIAGVETTNQYYVLKLDDDTFRICDAGIGGTITSNFERQDYIKFSSSGAQGQVFKYPDISVSIKYNTVGFGTTTQQNNDLIVTPVVKGSIIDAYVYEAGTGYGSTILNLEKKPLITIKNGKSAQLTPSIVDGKIVNVFKSYVGSEYYSTPDLVVSGSGTGAELRAIINNGEISEVKVLNTGIGYSASNTKIEVVSSGKNAFIDPQIRKLTLNDNIARFTTGEVLLEGKDKLQYSVSKYFENLRNSFKESEVGSGSTSISNIIGWAYDGNPIYGPYGYSDPNVPSGTRLLESGYILNTSNVEDRPSGFNAGFFVEDYQFNGVGDLDEYNGRYEKNVEYPNGVYAYHATIDQFPYFIGNKYKSKLISNSDLDQSFDFNNSNLLRNTLPYKVSELNADYDFISETSDVLDQKIEVVSVTSDSVKSIEIENSGSNYKVGDKLTFDDTDTSGSGLDVNIASIEGKNIVELNTNSTEYLNSIFTWESSNKVKVSILPKHNLLNLDYVTISGFSTNLSSLNGTHQIIVPSYANGRCLSTITSASVGFTTEIYVSPIPEQVSVGSSISIGTETLKVLEVFKNQNIIRIERGLAGVSHTVGTAVSFLPDSFTIAKSVDKFDSKVNDTVFFNPRESVGVGTISGVGYSTSFTFGDISTVTRSIPSKGIYIENHPFVTNQSVGFNTNGGIDMTVSPDGTSTSNLSSNSNLFIVKKGPSLIGLKTAIIGEELFFHTNGDDSDKYSFDSNYTQILGDVDKNVVTVSVSTSHELQNGDTVTLDVQPNLSVGIGTSTAVRVLYKSEIDNIVVNPIGFNSTGINTVTNEITITDHKLVTGDKVLYEDSGHNEYFVYKVNRNKINLCETLIDSQQNPPTVVSFASTGGSSQTISLINPQLQPVKNNNLVFDLSDSSLVNYSLRLYQDKEFNNEFVSTGSTNTFSVSGVGTVGVTSTAALTLDYNSQIGELFYTLEKDGALVKSDTDISNYSSIKYVNSDYNNSYIISGVAATTFNVNINKKPEKLSYGSTECNILDYSTSSTSPSGPVKSLSIISSGTGYKKLPSLKSTNSVSGIDLIVNAESINVGSIKESRVINNRFTYSPDKTLRPKVNVSPNIVTKDSNTLSQISIISGGEGYVSAPNITLVNSITRSVVNSGFIEAKITGSAISSLEIQVQPKGLPDETVEVFATNNNNGVAIEKVESSNTGIFTCIISTPGIGNTFNTPPFAVGDEVFIEGIIKSSSDGDGFNSSDYGYKFFKVRGYSTAGINDTVSIGVSEFTTNTGIAKTIQDFSGVIINKNDYPTFKVVQEPSKFFIGETLSSNQIIKDLEVTESDGDSLKVSGSYELSIGEVVTGNESGTVATIKSLNLNEGTFGVGYSNIKDIGWDTETGKLSEDFQVTPDNNYYQNLSYSVKSSITYRDQQSPVESLVHTSGLKNFADTGISSNTNVGLTTTNDGITIIYDVIDEKRVDTINNFDNVIDIDVVDSKSKFLKLKTKKLTKYTELKNINVLTIDDLQNQFSNSESESTEFLLVDELDSRTYFNYLLRVSSEDDTEFQLTDITILKNELESVIIENESISGQEFNYGIFDLFTDGNEKTFLRFVPNDALNTNYDLKVIKQIFNTNLSGVGTQSIGFVNLTGSVDIENTSVGIGTTTIISLNSNNFESLYVNAQVTNTVTNDMNYVRLYVSIAGTNSYMSEYYIDSNVLSSSTGNQIGTFYSNVDSGILSITHENTSSDELKIKTNIVGFGTTSTGIGTYRFKSSSQFDGQERSIIYDSRYYTTVGASSTTVQTLDKTLFNASKSLIQVSIGSTKALHQVMMVSDQTDVYTQQLPFLSASNDDVLDDAAGIGTFGGEISGSNLMLKFFPDANQTGQIDIEVFSKSFYSEVDTVNEPLDLSYGTVTESIDEKFYNAINLSRINKDSFELTDNGIPIFSKKFNPNSSALDASTGTFTIQNHFFVTGEELIYTPNSTIVGVGTSAVVTPGGELPSTVYAIKLTENTFKVAITTTAAAAGIGTTFTSLGEGNAHRFTMKERNTKCILTVDELVQYPIAPTKITHTLSGNVGGSLNNSRSIVSLSGISTINPRDILKVDDEYMGVTSVGLGTTNVGPITNEGSINLVEVKRGFVGSSASTHTDSTLVRIYKGSFNIEDSKIYFTEAPRGNSQISKTKNNLDFDTSSFSGRVFFKSDYENNKVYDDLSDEFTGIGRTFTLKVGGANTTGIGTEGASGLVFINNIYQSPKTDNNPTRFNYQILEDSSAGISTVEFSGITRPETDPLEYFVSDYDINANEVPRGGIIVSYGSTPGLGFAPLVGASVTAVVGAGGSIVSVGLGTTGHGSGYNGLVSIGISVYESGHSGAAATITANIGVGGTLSFNVVGGGTGYSNPEIFVSDPSYKNLPVVGVSRLGIGATTDTGNGLLVDLKVSGSTGIGSTLFEVSEVKFSRSGYNFRRGDVFKPVGLVTDGSLSSPISDFEITVVDTYSDNFAAWEFGELDYIDSIQNLQDGSRVRFPLNYNSELLSFEPKENSPIEKNINNILIIFVNGVLQKPIENYIFEGGTSFAFTRAPLPEEEIEIYFYKGVDGTDSTLFDDIIPTIETGDVVQVISNNIYPNTITQDERTVYNITTSDKLETNRYAGLGVDESNYKPLYWTKQKTDKKINGQYVYKSRDVLEPLIFPTARIIKDVSTTDTKIFVDNVELFNYETDNGYTDSSTPLDAVIIEDTNPVTALFTASIDGNGSVNGITTTNSGFGYLPNQTTINLKFVGIGTTTATATASITNGVVTGTTITNPGLGYTVAPTIFAETPNLNIEKITGFSNIKGFSGIVTGITTASGVGVPLALQFTLIDSNNFTGLSTGYPIYIYDTQIGSGVTSIDDSNSAVVGIGTNFLDNVYYVSSWSNNTGAGTTIGIITCNVDSNSNIVGLGTTGSTLNPVGKYSWGLLEGGTRSTNPISIGVTGNTVSGLTTYPTIQRRGIGIRKTGALPKREV